jgi:FdhD protein
VSHPLQRISDPLAGENFIKSDDLVIEEPLEIRIEFEEDGTILKKTVAMTMRTPGDDQVLALGFLFSEGMLASGSDVDEVISCGPVSPVHGGQNIVRVKLARGVTIPIQKIERLFVTNSSCGICGKTSFESLTLNPPQGEGEGEGENGLVGNQSPKIAPGVLFSLPAKLLNAQRAFARTGGVHAAALVSFEGTIESLFEDVGRHNAVDKIVGKEFLRGALPLKNKIILVSGRASFELVQKTIKAGASMLMALGAPSNLALDLAAKYGLTLIGFARDHKFNIYTGGHRIES